MVQKKPMKYLTLVRPSGRSWLEPRAKRTELSVRRMTQLRFEKVTFCFTIMTERIRLKTSCVERRRDEVETGRYELPHEKRRLLTPRQRPTKMERARSRVVKPEKGRLSV